MKMARGLALTLLAVAAAAAPAYAQIAPCSEHETSPNLPPATSGPLYRCAEIAPHGPGDRTAVVETMVDISTYAGRLTAAWSMPSQNRWMPYDETVIEGDFWRLWQTEFLDDLWVEVRDEPYSNGVMGKHVIFHLEERPRLKIVDYLPIDENEKLKVEISKIESTLREQNISLRVDSMIDESDVRKVVGVIRDLYADQGYNDAIITTERTAMPGGPKLLHLTFRIDPGPKVEIADIVFDGNKTFPDSKLRRQLKDNKPKGFLGFLGDATYHEAKFADDSERVMEFYREHGYASAQVGMAQSEVIRTSADGKKRWIRLRVPVDEGQKYTVGKFEITGESKLNLTALRSVFKIEEGDVYSSKKIRKGLEKMKEAFGAYGFWQYSPDPQLTPRGIDPTTGQPTGPNPPPPIMDVDIHVDEGKQFFVNRITFTGNTNTHDEVIRREMRIAEGGVFNDQALKESVRRLNQLGYFKPFENKEGEMDITQTPGTDDKVDVKLKFEEQNRNQLSFGAGISQYDGFFGQLAFQTANFLGRGETLGVSLQRGSQASQYQLSFSEPYLFDRPLTLGTDLFSREYIFPLQYTQQSRGTNFVFGFPIADFTRGFMQYSYEQIRVFDINPSYTTPEVLSASPYLADSLLLSQGGKRIVSKISPSIVFNTVNQPIFPTAGRRYSVAFDLAGIGGNTQYTQTRLEGIWYKTLSSRTSFGLHAEGTYIRPYGSTTTLPIFEKLFTGGEYSIRGFDLRTVGPRDPVSGVLIGGNKEVTFNAEYYINLFPQVRLVAFYDAGQVQDLGTPLRWKDPITATIVPPPPFLIDALGVQNLLTAPGAIHTEVIGHTSAFKTSTGLEVRFMMPVLNVPFRLIGSYNPQRLGVLDNNLQQTKAFTFRFAVGTTF
jgi:outer membrane protein insertion porin family